MASSPSTVLPAAVVQHCISFSRIFSDDLSPSAPTCRYSNIWGDFTFRAQWLDQNNPGSDLIGIIVSHEVPLPLRLTRNVQRLPLSRRQAEVCVLMATGASNEEIAVRLGISRHTAKQHGRWIYDKLDVHNRTELVSKILST
jgi:DNA-binding CsgD family transcriptional regulator